MKSVLKSLVAAMVFSTVIVGVAWAIIPQGDLKKNSFPDEGVSSQVLSDIDAGRFKIDRDSGSNLSEIDKVTEPQSQFQYQYQLFGKHLI